MSEPCGAAAPYFVFGDMPCIRPRGHDGPHGNVECPTCGGTRTVGEYRPGWGRSVRSCPDCTPENVEEPT